VGLPWSVVAWLDARPDAVQDNRDLSEGPVLPAPPEVIAGCPAQLSIRSDVDAPDFDNSDRFTEYTDLLREPLVHSFESSENDCHRYSHG
jgi:hypothetical protein